MDIAFVPIGVGRRKTMTRRRCWSRPIRLVWLSDYGQEQKSGVGCDRASERDGVVIVVVDNDCVVVE